VYVASVPQAIREMDKCVPSLGSVQLTMVAVTRWPAAWTTLVNMTKTSFKAEQLYKMLCMLYML
jgi:hypothetical protein